MKPSFHYGVIGLGPVGAVIATHLGSGGHKVTIMDINAKRVETLLASATEVSGALQARTQFKSGVSDLKAFVAAKPDVVMIATKNCDSPGVLKTLKDLGLADSAIIVSCQNGLDVEEQAIEVFGSHRALRMVLNMGAGFDGPNSIKVNFAFPHVLSLRQNVDADLSRKIVDDLNASGFKTELREDYRISVFKKAILNSSLGSVCALTGMTMKSVMKEPELSRMVKQIVREGIWIAQAMGLGITMDFLDEAVAYLSQGGDHKPSILTDLENGRPTENEYLCGKLFAYAQKYAVEVAVTQTIYYLVKNKEQDAIRQKALQGAHLS